MKSMLLAFCCFCIATITVAQEGAKSGSVVELLDILERIIELNPDYDFEELSDYLEGIVDNPLDINTVSARELSRLSLLNDFQIESLLEYRRIYGHLRSVNELAVVPGFDYKLMKAISPLFKAVTNVRESSGRGFDNSYSARFRGRVTYPLSKGMILLQEMIMRGLQVRDISTRQVTIMDKLSLPIEVYIVVILLLNVTPVSHH